MKRIPLLSLPAAVLLFVLTCAFIQVQDSCDTKGFKDRAKAALDPFKYDSGKLTRLYYKKKDQQKETEVPVFFGETYRFVWNTEGLSRKVKVTVYNKDKESKGRKELFSFVAAPGKNITTFDPEKRMMKYYVDYDLPSVSDSLPPSECVVMMLGYKGK